MIKSANSVLNGARLKADVCVVGAGPAGIALTLALAERGIHVLLLESGLAGKDDKTQSLYEGEVADALLHSPLDKYRQRRLGGSSVIWGGRCMPFDPLDFEVRSQVPDSGWPISYEDLLPYYVQANSLAEAGRFLYNAKEALGPDVAPMIRGFESARVRTDGLERFSCPTDFGKRYARRLQVAPEITVLLGANCTDICMAADGQSVQSLEVTTLAGVRFEVESRVTVLAAGGLEIVRLLLASRRVAPQGIGNANDVVGCYYMCHIAGNVGQLSLTGPTKDVQHGYAVSPEGIYCRRRFSLTAAEQQRQGTGNAVARLHFPRIGEPAHRSGVLSGLYLARKLINYEYSKRLNDGNPATLKLYARHLLNVLMAPADTAAFLAHWVSKRTLAPRKFPSVILRNRTNLFSLELHAEHFPRRDSRVTLSDKVDSLGMPRLHVDWRYGQNDIESIRRMLDTLSLEFVKSKVGQFKYNPAMLEQDLTHFGAYGGHHIGTARMGHDARTSVVNADCQVHSVRNLFVTGSAVFPTSSQANPTLTLIALSLRLGDQLGRRMKADSASFPMAGSSLAGVS